MRKRYRDNHLPKSVYHRHGAYWFVRQGKWQRLGADLQSALAAYGRLVAKPAGSMGAIVDSALERKKQNIAGSTYKQYEVAAYKIKSMLKGLEPHEVLPRHVAQLKLNLASTPNMANRVLSFLRIVFDYALEWQLVDSNPAIGIKRYPEKQRERLITEDEYKAIYAKAPRRLQIIMELCYLTGQRISDVLNIRHADISDDGIYFRQQKTKARLLVRWSPALHETVDAAKALHGNVRAITLLHNRKGNPPDYRTTKDQWNLACARAEVSNATLHDLRAMSGTAAEAQGLDPTQLLGHTSPNQTKRYLRAKKIPQVTGPSFLASPIGHAKKVS